MQSYYVQINHQKLHYLENGEGECIVLLPSLSITSESYRELGDLLSKDFHVIIPDLYKGKSRFSKSVGHVKFYSQAFEEFIEKMNIKNYYLIGISGSGLLSSYIVKSIKNKPNKMLLFSTTFDPTILKYVGMRLLKGFPKLMANNMFSIRGIRTSILWLKDGFGYFLRHPIQFLREASVDFGQDADFSSSSPIDTTLFLAGKDEFFADINSAIESQRVTNLRVEKIDGSHCWFFLKPEKFIRKIVDSLCS
ncbi:alpha/beta fold hydrolase [Patescibacteria group bacterium]